MPRSGRDEQPSFARDRSAEQPAPFGFRPVPAFFEDGRIAVVEDDAGTIMVKRYRLTGAQ